MRLDHPDYVKLVIGAYNKMKANSELSPSLSNSTPANIRRECVNVYQERHEKKDEPALRAFFGPAEHGKKFLSVIQEFDVNKFKPLDNYLKRVTEKTDNKNLDLLAWLINFPHRPFVIGMNVLLNNEELSLIGKRIDCIGEMQAGSKPVEGKIGLDEEGSDSMQTEIAEGTDESIEKTSIPFISGSKINISVAKPKKVLMFFLAGVITVGSLYIFRQPGKGEVFGNTNTGCMYWADDHYEKVPCNEERNGRLILPLDEERMKNFRKITREDTITERSIGKIHYLKDNRVLEYFTASGNHPVEVTRTLKVLSRHMFDTYLGKKQASGKDSTVVLNNKP